MSGLLDLSSIDVLGVAECDLDLPTVAAHEWPCPACGEQQPVGQAWALKIRNRNGAPMERAVVVCDGCFANLGEVLAGRTSGSRVTISTDDDPIELLRTTLDTDEVEVPFRL